MIIREEIFMENYCGLSFRKFTENDVECFTKIMKRAFDKDTQIHTGQNEGGPDGYDNGDFLKKWYLHNDVTSFAIFNENQPIGAVALWINQNNENFLGNIFIDTEHQDKGIGLTIWQYVQQKYPETTIWRTETPGFSTRNHHFYVNKCGFKIYKIKNPKKIMDSSFLLEKEMKNYKSK